MRREVKARASAQRLGIFIGEKEVGKLPELLREALLTQIGMLPVCAKPCAGHWGCGTGEAQHLRIGGKREISIS